MSRTRHTLAAIVTLRSDPLPNSLCLHTIRHKFHIVTQELPDPSQSETRVAVYPVGLARAVFLDGPRFKFPSRLSSVHASDEKMEEGKPVVVVDQRYLTTEYVLIQTLDS